MKNLQKTNLQIGNFISLLDNEENIGNNSGDPDKEEKPPGARTENEEKRV